MAMEPLLSTVFNTGDNVLIIARHRKRKDKPKYFHHVMSDELHTDVMRYKNLNDQGYDISFVVSTIKEAHVGQFKGITKTDCLDYCRVFFIDIDLKTEDREAQQGGYETYDEAKSALDKLVSGGKVPQYSALVNSGGGLHVYWRLKTKLTIDEWKRANVNFAASIQKLDPDLVTDLDASKRAQVHPKLPHDQVDFRNVKRKTVVTLVHNKVSQLDGSKYTDTAASKVKAGRSAKDVVTEGELFELNDLLPVCGLPKFAMYNPNKVTEPLWMSVATIFCRMKDGNKAFHKLSERYKSYDESEAEEKFQSAKGYKNSTGCAKIAMHSKACGGPCATCKFAKFNMSPVDLAARRRSAQQKKTDPILMYLPAKYYISAELQLMKDVKVYDKGNNTFSDECIIVHDDPVVVTKVCSDETTGESWVEIKHVDRLASVNSTPVWKRELVKASKLTEARTAKAELVNKQIIVYSERMRDFLKFIDDSMRHLRDTQGTHTILAQLGWVNKRQYAVKNRIIEAKGYTNDPLFSQETSAACPTDYSKAGSYNDWRKGFNILVGKPGCEPHSIVALSAFATPLLKLLPNATHGLMLNIQSDDTGVGKSTSLKLMQSVFGSTDRFTIDSGDTAKARMRKLSVACDTPITWDEITRCKDIEISEFLYSLSNGTMRSTLTKDQAMHTAAQARTWNTIVVSSSNPSLHDKIITVNSSSAAELARLIEFHIDRPALNEQEGLELRNLIGDNYGHVWDKYIQYVISNQDGIIQNMKTLRSRIAKNYLLTSGARYWSDFATVWVTGAEIAKKLGFHDYDVQALQLWLYDNLLATDAEIVEEISDPSDYLWDFIRANSDGILTTAREFDGSEIKKEDNSVNGRSLLLASPREIVGHVVLNNKKSLFANYYINKVKLRQYIKQANYAENPTSVIKRLIRDKLIDETSYPVGKCKESSLATPSTRCVRINMQHPKARSLKDGLILEAKRLLNIQPVQQTAKVVTLPIKH